MIPDLDFFLRWTLYKNMDPDIWKIIRNCNLFDINIAKKLIWGSRISGQFDIRSSLKIIFYFSDPELEEELKLMEEDRLDISNGYIFLMKNKQYNK